MSCRYACWAASSLSIRVIRVLVSVSPSRMATSLTDAAWLSVQIASATASSFA